MRSLRGGESQPHRAVSTHPLSFPTCSEVGESHGSFVEDNYIYVAMNFHWGTHWFELPRLPPGMQWHVFANTAVATPHDSWEPGDEPLLEDQSGLPIKSRSVVVLVGK